MLMTSSFDRELHLYDIRRPGELLFALSGHCSASTTQQHAIHHPQFVCDGSVIVTTGDEVSRLTFFSTASGDKLHSWATPNVPLALAVHTLSNTVYFSLKTRELVSVSLFP